jgi:hypothetical protein
MLRGSVSKTIEDFLLEMECFIPDYARTVPATTMKTRKSDVNVATDVIPSAADTVLLEHMSLAS